MSLVSDNDTKDMGPTARHEPPTRRPARWRSAARLDRRLGQNERERSRAK
jgi:hypothetical protein